MITERLMAPGEWRIQLRPNTPLDVLRRIDWAFTADAGLAHIVIVPGGTGFQMAGLAAPMSLARYAGVVLDYDFVTGAGYTLSGAGMPWWLSTHFIEVAITFTAGTVSDWGSNLKTPALTDGTYNNSGTGTLTATYNRRHYDDVLNEVMEILGAEWRVNPNATLDCAKSDILFGALSSTSPVLSRFSTNARQRIRVLQGRRSLRDYRSRAFVLDGVTEYKPNAATFYKDQYGGNALITEYATVTVSGDGSNQANRILAQHTPATYVQVDAGDWKDLRAGQYVWIHDEALGLFDAANTVRVGGVDTHPLASRIYGLTWPVRTGMGVWHRAQGTVTTWTDLTPWVVFDDDSNVVVDLGRLPNTLANPYGRYF